MGSSCFLHSPIHHSCFPLSSSSSSSSSSQSVVLYSCVRNAETKKTKNRAPMVASLSNESSKDGGFCKRRAVLFVGVSLLPLLQLRARAIEGLVTVNLRIEKPSFNAILSIPVNLRIEAKLRKRIRRTFLRADHINITDEREVTTPEEKQPEEKQKTKQAIQSDAPPNPFLSLLNGLGVVSSGVLGALYLLAQQEKKDTEASIESIKSKLKEKEAAIVSMEKNFEVKFVNEQEERTQQLKKVKEEQESLMNQLTSANSIIKGLGQELQSEKRLIGELKIQLDSLKTDLSEAGEGKKALEEKLKEKLDLIEVLQERINLLSLEIKEKEDEVQNLFSALAERESEVSSLNTVSLLTKKDLAKANSEIKGLKEKLLKNQEELECKQAKVDDLNAIVSALIVERDYSNKQVDAIQKELNDLKVSSEKKAALDSKILGEKDDELHRVKEKLELALAEASENQNVIVDLTQERDDLRKMLDLELNNVRNLKDDLRITQEVLETSKNEASDLTGQLKKSRNLCTELEAELFRVGAEFSEAKNSLQRRLDESKKSIEVLASELRTAKELLKKTKDELQIVSHKLTAAAENGDSLQKELVDVYKKAESTANDLKEEKKIITGLNKELKALEKQILKDKDGRKSLETDLEEATKSLDEMSRNALLLSRELERANSQISGFEEEKDLLYSSLAEQKNFSQEARENMEDAHNLVMRLGKERESLEKRGKKLEEELASAKGEILRLRSQINSSTTATVNDQHQEKTVKDQHKQKVEAEDNVVVAAKKSGRRRKSSPQ